MISGPESNRGRAEGPEERGETPVSPEPAPAAPRGPRPPFGGSPSEGAQEDCPFCRIVAGAAPAQVLREWPDALAIVPRHPVTPGHALVIPRTHVADVAVDPAVSASTMRRAAEMAFNLGECNIITSRGESATQSVFHLHMHVLPRRPEDGLALPWTPAPRYR
ncbi:hypothetical protein GCM10010269_53560 [Streptomyces humidus]|uniref:HIT domain-containing protein n=1 Tax=Streptomyces humidus TaxID=52259 RepID=A0A918L643_9ACTN|nr:HIT domain-containing protein [Streptomyces humidus]GGS07823.1 hypothetical protein GCM10010269_53560 [Streptomyces humidus]